MPRSFSRGLVPGSFPIRQRWRAEDARVILGRLEASGLSVRQFAARENLEVQRLYRWRAQLDSTTARGAAFVEIKPMAVAIIEVVLRSGDTLRVPRDFDEETLRRLLATLEERASRC
jgi:hypothetical protein